ncbi:hypothetical protein [Nocardia sp. alder85J]|uniref:hypothetical protein n=1 Tax=Nocardia sp. alder85J TaxID=2862949 RepID=UPI001CD68995|nr:hypothetical protein [Nocardia sp. alder85J]MCX4095084.1 hypothetical protein [Nocardia sp. alder85J]
MGDDITAALRRLADERRTGVLALGDGALHFAEGEITAAACPRTPALERLVVTTGVATAADWQRAQAGDPGSVLRRPRLQMLALLSVFDAAYFLLATPVTPVFRPAPAHWLSAVCRIPIGVLVHECARRHAAESGPWPMELVDRTPVVPAGRHRKRVPLTSGEAEILAAADARRSIAGIAGDLGRTSYGCLVAVRRLTGVGLLEEPGSTRPGPAAPRPAAPAPPTRPESAPAARRESAPPARPVSAPPDRAASALSDPAASAPPDSVAPAPPTRAVPAPPARPAAAAKPRPLPRRRKVTVIPPEAPPPGDAAAPGPAAAVPPGATAPTEVAVPQGDTAASPETAVVVPELWKPVDRELLIRLRTALEEFA